MRVQGKECRAVWREPGDEQLIRVIDQRFLPHRFVIEELSTVGQVACAISEMHVRGAPLIGAVAAYGMYFAAREAIRSSSPEQSLAESAHFLKSARPTAVNLGWAVDRQLGAISSILDSVESIRISLALADTIVEEEVERCQRIGVHGSEVLYDLRDISREKPLQVLTHCNAGWLACIDYGTATAPLYQLHDQGVPIHVWVDETRPRNQGARLTAWELGQHGIPHTVVADNTGGLLMSKGMVDVVIVGTDRTTRCGDVVNKIGTYLKALAAYDNQVPFYVALPSSSLDWSISRGAEVPIEERSSDEVKYIQGLVDGELKQVRLTSAESAAVNFGFDVTPAKFITGFITERGVCRASEDELAQLFPEIAGVGKSPL